MFTIFNTDRYGNLNERVRDMMECKQPNLYQMFHIEVAYTLFKEEFTGKRVNSSIERQAGA